MNRGALMTVTQTILAALAAPIVLAGPPPEPEAEGTVFTYQGRLLQSGSLFTLEPGCGCDMTFELFETETAFPGETSIGVDVLSDVAVDKGLFTVELDFGFNPFDGLEKWLELNTKFASTWPNITAKGEPPADADDFKDEQGKFEKYFSEEPGEGD